MLSAAPWLLAATDGHIDVARFLGTLAIVLITARLFAAAAQRIGQPSVLGELIAGVLLGASVFGVVDSQDQVLHLLAEIGVVILLFEIGLETDLKQLIQVGATSAAVALAGVVLPFSLGYAVCYFLDLTSITSIVVAATLTATSVGITARVLSDLGRLSERESQIILGAAVIDDVVGLIILAVVEGLTQGEEITIPGVVWITLVAFGFLLVTLLLGRLMVPPLAKLTTKIPLAGTLVILAVAVAFTLAWLADRAGSAMIIGAFAAGLLLREAPGAEEMEHGVADLGHFFVPLFFVYVGSSVDVNVLNPLNPENYRTLLIGGLLIVAAVIGKFASGYAPWWFNGRKNVIGVGMIPRGEVGLIFAQMGLSAGVFDAGLFSAVTLMVMATTFIAPPLLKAIFPARPQPGPPEHEGISELVT